MLDTTNGIGIEIDRKQVCHYLGYGADYEPPARVSSLIDEYAEHALHLIKPAYSYIIKNIERVDGFVTLGPASGIMMTWMPLP